MAGDLANLLSKLAGKRKTKKKNSIFSRLKKHGSSTEKKALEAAALVAATRRVDYTRLLKDRAKIGDYIQKATADYKHVEERLKSIEKDEMSKVIGRVQNPTGLFW